MNEILFKDEKTRNKDFNPTEIEDPYKSKTIESENQPEISEVEATYRFSSCVQAAIVQNDLNELTKVLESYYNTVLIKVQILPEVQYDIVDQVLDTMMKLFVQVTFHQEHSIILTVLIRSILYIIHQSHYYAIKMANQPFIGKLLSIVADDQLPDEVKTAALNTFCIFSQHDETKFVVFELMPLNSLLSLFQQPNCGILTKLELIELFEFYISSKQPLTCEQYKSYAEVVSSTIKAQDANYDISIRMLATIGMIVDKHPEEARVLIYETDILEFIIVNLELILSIKEERILGQISAIIGNAIMNGVIINIDFEKMFAQYLKPESSIRKKEIIVGIISNMILKIDKLDFNRNILVPSFPEVLVNIFVEGNVNMKRSGVVLLAAAITLYDISNVKQIISSSTIMENLLDFICGQDNVKTLNFSVGLIGSIISMFAGRAENDPDFVQFLTFLENSQVIQNINENCPSQYSEALLRLLNNYNICME